MILDADGNVLIRQVGFLRRMRREQVAEEPTVECISSQRVEAEEEKSDGELN